MNQNHNDFPQDHSGGKFLILTLAEVKSLIASTKGQRCPKARHLRERGKLLVRKDMDDCSLEVYTSGFAIFRTSYVSTVLRVDRVCESASICAKDTPGICSRDENKDWSIALMRCGEKRIAAGIIDTSEAGMGFYG